MIVRTSGGQSVADADVTKFGIQDVCTVTRAVHPNVDDIFRCRCACRNILATKIIAIPFIEYSFIEFGAVQTVMAEVVPASHVLGMKSGSSSQVRIIAEGFQTVGSAFGVDQIDDVGFEIGLTQPSEYNQNDDC